MQTIEEYKEYTAQLEGEVKKWRDAFDASQEHVQQLMKENRDIKDTIKRLQDSIIKKTSAQFTYDETIKQLTEFID